MKQSSRFGLRQSWVKVLGTSIRPGREEGGALYEFAMVLPLLGMLLVAIIYGGITFYNYVELTNAVAIGARTLATNRAQLAGPPTACTMEETALKNAAANLITSQITIAAESFTGTPIAATCSDMQQGAAATVTATYPCNLTIPFSNINLCPVTGGTAACPTAYCISATTTVYIQ
jgi:Flp pilus assembly protein TadG